MGLANAVIEAKNFLKRSQRDDGGIPAVSESDPSGFWTTAEAVDVILQGVFVSVADYHFVEKCVDFLLGGQLDSGAWPLGPVGSKVGSAMATGHTLATLARLKSGSVNLARSAESEKAIGAAKGWLEKTQLANGLWGVEPEVAGGNDGKMLSTFYASYGLILCGCTSADSIAIRRVVTALETHQGSSGGWPHQIGEDAAVSATAMGAQTLALLSQDRYNDRIERGLGFILQNHGDLDIQNVSYVVAGGSGQVNFHYNTLCEVGMAIVASQSLQGEVLLKTIVERLLATQATSGAWPLQGLKRTEGAVTMWSTAEYCRLLSLVARWRLQAGPFVTVVTTTRRHSSWYLYAALLATIVYAAAATDIARETTINIVTSVSTAWAALPAWARWVLTVVGGLMGALISTLFVESARAGLARGWNRITGRFNA